jgi:hypothetical protein
VDLEKSFGPIYTRGILRRGRSAFAVLGVNQYETQASIDAALTFGILWLDACRHQLDQRILVEGLKLFLPAGSWALTRERLVHLNSGAAKWHLYEHDERHDAIAEVDYSDRGNIATHLVRCPNEAGALERFEESIHHLLGMLPETEVAVLSPAEIAFRWRGLEFARARVTHDAVSFIFRKRAGTKIYHRGSESQRKNRKRKCARARKRPRRASSPPWCYKH